MLKVVSNAQHFIFQPSTALKIPIIILAVTRGKILSPIAFHHWTHPLQLIIYSMQNPIWVLKELPREKSCKTCCRIVSWNVCKGQQWEIQPLLFLRVNDKGGVFLCNAFSIPPSNITTASALQLDASTRCALITSGDFLGDISHLSALGRIGGLADWVEGRTLELRNFLAH